MTEEESNTLTSGLRDEVKNSFLSEIAGTANVQYDDSDENPNDDSDENPRYLKPVAVLETDDPYLEHMFSTEGTYVVQVGYVESTIFQQSTTLTRASWWNFRTTETVDTSTESANHSWEGVAPGTSYDLNMSVQELSLIHISEPTRLV